MYISAIKYYFSAKGRINRRQFLLVLTISIILSVIVAAIIVDTSHLRDSAIVTITSLLVDILLIPSQIKRLHDLNWNGWFTILGFIPGIAFFFRLILVFFGGTSEENKYGIPPHLQTSDIEKVSNIVSNITDKTTVSISNITQKVKDSFIKSIAASIGETQKEVEKQRNLPYQEKIHADIKEIEELKKRILELEEKLIKQEKDFASPPITDESNKNDDDYEGDKKEIKEEKNIDFAFINEYLHKEEFSSILDEKEVKIMRFRFGIDSGEPKSLQEVSNKFNITREEVRQIEEKNIKILMNLRKKGCNLEKFCKKQETSSNIYSNNLTNNKNSNEDNEDISIGIIILLVVFFTIFTTVLFYFFDPTKLSF